MAEVYPPDALPERDRALAISLEREVSVRISPILLIDFGPVFAYASIVQEGWLPTGAWSPGGA